MRTHLTMLELMLSHTNVKKLLTRVLKLLVSKLIISNNAINRDPHEFRPKLQASTHGVTLLNR